MTIRYGSSANTANTSKLRSGVSRTVQVLVVAGGGGGGSGGGGNPSFIGGPGGAGGFLEFTAFSITLGTAYTISIGAGGGGSSRPNGVGQGADGSVSYFGNVVSYGGGGGGSFYWNGGNNTVWNSYSGINGGSGGGSGIASNVPISSAVGGAGYFGQGNSGGAGFFQTSTPSNIFCAGGGGGAGSAGGAASASAHGAGGSGGASTLNGVTYASGGTAGVNTAGAANTGNGGGASGGLFNNGTAGGSGIVVVRFSSVLTPTIAAGLSYTNSFATNGDKIYRFTAGTDTISFA